VSKVLTIVLENHGVDAVTHEMPHLVQLGRTYGSTTAYSALRHPSLPNYLALAAGSTVGVRDDASPAHHPVPGPSVFDQAVAAGRTARTYAEAMPAPCTRENAGRYLVRHNPWTYFSDPASQQACATDDVPAGTTAAGALHDDLAAGALPTVGLLVPDSCDDAHDCSLATADAWVAGWTSQVLKGPDWAAGRLALVVTFDESEPSGDNVVLTVVAAPGLSGTVARGPLTHLSWSRWMSTVAGGPPLRDAGGASSLGEAFGLS
jgi:acid phosphatase